MHLPSAASEVLGGASSYILSHFHVLKHARRLEAKVQLAALELLVAFATLEYPRTVTRTRGAPSFQLRLGNTALCFSFNLTTWAAG